MKLKLICSVLALLVACANAEAQKAPLLAVDSPTAIDREYIVVMKEEIADLDVESHKNIVRNIMHFHGNTSTIKFEYNIGKGFRGYSVFADDKMIDMLRTMKEVKYIEKNQEAHAFQDAECKREKNAEWGLTRTIERNPNQRDHYTYKLEANGRDVNAYIIDTGIYLEHEEFEGRAKWGHDSVDTPSPKNDLNGHGTHVAGTVIGQTYGLARGATAIAVRVLDEFGSGSFGGVIAGVNYVADEYKKDKTKKSVANMSLGGDRSAAMNDAVDAAIKEGVHFAIAAGNDNRDACNYSPASSESVTVAAIDSRDTRSYFSNYGSCVEIFAPGSDIKSAYPDSKTATATLSGTSMAAPHVCGVMAKILSEEGHMSPKVMLERLEELATEGKVTNPGTGSPNKLLYHPCGEAQMNYN